MESLAGALGIANLTPTSEAARFARRPGEGLRGYALINGGDDRMALSLWLENGRPLNDRTGRDGFYYEVWLGDLSVGPFNTDATGHGCLTTSLSLATERPIWPTGAPPALISLAEQLQSGLPADLPIRVTVEPFGGTPAGGLPVLEGVITWLGAVPPLGDGDPPQEALSLSGAPELAEAAPELLEAEPEEELVSAAESTPEVRAEESPAAAEDEEPVAPTISPWSSPEGSRSETIPAWLAQPFGARPATPPVAMEATPEVTADEALEADQPAVAAPESTTEVAEPPEVVEPPEVIPTRIVSSAPPWLQATPAADPPAEPVFTEEPAEPEATPEAAAPTELSAIEDESPEGALEAAAETPEADEPVAAEEPTPTPDREAQLAALLDQNLVITRRPLIRPVAQEPKSLAPVFRVKPVHPLVPRVHASGTLDSERGALTIQVRSLPSPSALGKNEATGRPWSAYRAWLTHSATGASLVLGLLNRGSVDQWRLEVPEGLPLTRFDTVLVCLDERTNVEPRPTPIVLQGSILA